jgi:hypothetical protein
MLYQSFGQRVSNLSTVAELRTFDGMFYSNNCSIKIFILFLNLLFIKIHFKQCLAFGTYIIFYLFSLFLCANHFSLMASIVSYIEAEFLDVTGTKVLKRLFLLAIHLY